MKLFLLLMGLSGISLANAQNLDQHQWKDRLILLVSPSFENQLLQQQLTILKSDEEGLADRKLVIFQISDKGYKTGLNATVVKPLSSEFLGQFEIPDNGFNLYLIGLDGGIKMKENQIVPLSKIFALIDSMPMRRAELSGRKRGGGL